MDVGKAGAGNLIKFSREISRSRCVSGPSKPIIGLDRSQQVAPIGGSGENESESDIASRSECVFGFSHCHAARLNASRDFDNKNNTITSLLHI